MISLTNFANPFSPHSFKKNDEVILSFFQTDVNTDMKMVETPTNNGKINTYRKLHCKMELLLDTC